MVVVGSISRQVSEALVEKSYVLRTNVFLGDVEIIITHSDEILES